MRKEKAEALGRAGERVEQALQEREAFRQELLGLVAATRQCVHDGER